MKCIINSIICAFFLINFTLYAHNDEISTQPNKTFISRISSQIYNLGETVNDTEVPLIGKLGNILPFGMISFCLKEFPGQTIGVIAATLVYILYQNENVYNFLQKYNIIKKNQKKIEKNQRFVELSDDFFVFDGDDLLDAEEQEDNEEELLEEDTDKSEHSKFRKKKTANFL